MSETFDLLLVNGTVLNPAAGPRQALDVGITGGRISAMQAGLPRDGAKNVLDVKGCFVTPGLIDFHVHSYWGVNPYGCDLDSVCCATGVTTTADAGSAGPVNFLGFRHLVYERARTPHAVLRGGGAARRPERPGGARVHPLRRPEGAARTVRENPDVAVGIKIRMHVTSVGDNGREALGMAVQAGDACDSPVMVHVGNTGISMEEIVETLRPGDIVTHCYTPERAGHRGPVRPSSPGRLGGAQARGDLRRRPRQRALRLRSGEPGHGPGACVRTSSAPISTAAAAPATWVDLPTTLTKFLMLGLDLDEIVADCTINAARAIGWEDRLGVLEVGREADVAVLAVVDEGNEPGGQRRQPPHH